MTRKKEFAPPPTATTVAAPAAEVISLIAASVADKSLAEIQKPIIEEIKNTHLERWSNASDEGLKPLFTFRAPNQVAELLSHVSECSGFSQNDITLESSWTLCLARVLNENQYDTDVVEYVRNCIQKNRKRWRGRTLEDALNEQIELLTNLKRVINE